MKISKAYDHLSTTLSILIAAPNGDKTIAFYNDVSKSWKMFSSMGRRPGICRTSNPVFCVRACMCLRFWLSVQTYLWLCFCVCLLCYCVCDCERAFVYLWLCGCDCMIVRFSSCISFFPHLSVIQNVLEWFPNLQLLTKFRRSADTLAEIQESVCFKDEDTISSTLNVYTKYMEASRDMLQKRIGLLIE